MKHMQIRMTNSMFGLCGHIGSPAAFRNALQQERMEVAATHPKELGPYKGGCIWHILHKTEDGKVMIRISRTVQKDLKFDDGRSQKDRICLITKTNDSICLAFIMQASYNALAAPKDLIHVLFDALPSHSV